MKYPLRWQIEGTWYRAELDLGPGTVKVASIREEMRGAGDLIAKAAKAVGIKPCGGCQKRQAALNRLIPLQSGHAE